MTFYYQSCVRLLFFPNHLSARNKVSCQNSEEYKNKTFRKTNASEY